MKVLSDHNLEGQAILLWSTMESEGWLKLLPVPLLTFADVGLPFESSDRVVWRYAQEHNLILLTANRNEDGEDSLGRTIQDENTATSLPVVTIGTADRLEESYYRERCAEKLMEIVLYIERYRGVGRVFIP
ncbi:MAG: ACP S-malonyltransferase [Chloroflexi bacterium]|nr:ACP S-malonyltransferase [Chloroflexota bacterium]